MWLAWLAQQEVGGIYPALQAFAAAPPPLPDWLSGLPGLGDWLTQQRAQMLADPQDMIAAAKDWLAAHSSEAAALAGGVEGLQVVVVHWSPAQAIFRTVELSLQDWGLAGLTAASVLLLEEARKLVARVTR